MSNTITLEEKRTVDFEGSPGHWKTSKLRNLLAYDVSGTWGDDPDDGNGLPVLRATNFGEDAIDLDDVAYRKISASHRESKRLEIGDLILERSGGSADQPTGRILFFDLDGEYYPGNFLRLLRPDIGRVNGRYLYYFLDYRYRRGDTIPIQSSSISIRNLQYNSYLNLDVQLPPLDEQRKIASVLLTVDRAIQDTVELIRHYERLQTGLLRKHFGKPSVQDSYSEERTVKHLGPKSYRVPVDWEVVRIADLGEIVTGDTPSTSNEEYYGGGLPFVTPADFSEGKYVLKGSRRLTKKGKSKSRPVPEGAVMVDCIGMDMGKVRIAGCELATNQQINSVVVDSDAMLPEFLYYHLKAISNRIKAQAGQTRTPIVSKSQFGSFEVFKPPIKAQQDVVASLSAFDDLIENESMCRYRLQRLKKGLMQDLLTGRVRTAGKNIDVLDEVQAHG